MTEKKSGRRQDAPQLQSRPAIVWDDENARSVYGNVFNVAGSPEEFVISLGISQSWGKGQKDLKVRVSDRILMSPHAAKRLAILLNGVIREYESRFGPLQIEKTQQAPAVALEVPANHSGATRGRKPKTKG